MKSSSVAALVVATTAALLVTNSHAAVCTTAEISTADALISTNKALFQSCLTDLKSASGASATSFISTAYASSTDGAAGICASDNCVKSLIAAMENMPDCCSPAGSSGVSAVTNLPRLADDILHQCDLIDETLLATELSKEIEKLPDLKVNIKSVSSNSTSSGSGSSNASSATVGSGVDVVIDVKKRELMKDGTAAGSNSTDVEPASSGAGDALFMRASQTVLTIALVAVLSVVA
ncbi:hypothetical protein Gpo141_00013371 [Globisporangium polare]